MGFECGLCKMKKLGNATASQAMAASYYARYLKWDNSYPFDSYTELYSMKSLPDNIDEYLADEDTAEDNVIEYWCSSGHAIDSLMRSCGTKDNDCYYIYTEEQLKNLLKKIDEFLEGYELIPVSIKYAYRYTNDKDDSIKMIPLDGVFVELPNGDTRDIPSENFCEQIYVLDKPDDSSLWLVYKQLRAAVITAIQESKQNFIYYFISD